ncbi:unnamed protein product [Caenorhabditis bovis]|uniref:ubiquitinyl hydrolase 1 n=2 Tax=Caenorhabditis TaxID=6237 RepID=A0A8S1E7Q8_9PELO|nr:unnamed protein product [Caenorhabditis bovis]
MSANQRTDCFFNLTTTERIDLFRKRQSLRLENVYRTYYGWLMMPLAIIGAICTAIYLVSTYKAIKLRRVSRKCYILLVNRAIGDLLTCTSALVTVIYVLTWHDINRDMVMVIESFFIGSFWSAMISYTSLSVLKLFAVWKPFHYRKWFTMKRCIYLMIISWIIFIIMVSYTLAVSALVKLPSLNSWSGCKAETCLRAMYKSRNFLTASVYFFTLIVFISTVIFLRRAQSFSNSFKKREENKGGRIRMVRFPLWKLAINVGTFAVLNVFYVIWCVLLVLNTDPCLFQRNFSEMMLILGIVRTSLVIRCILDPILSFFTDFQIRRCLLEILGIRKKIADAGSRSTFKQSYSSSSADQNSIIDRGTRSQTYENKMNSSGLKYHSIEELQSSSSLPRELSNKFENMKCEEVHKHLKNLLEKARSARGDNEMQYQHYMRSAELADIIRKHKDFKNFIKQKSTKLLFHKDFTDCIEQITNLQSVLSKKYDELKLRNDKMERVNSIDSANESKASEQDITISNDILISPKELVRMVEKDAIKKSAIILDYRENKNEVVYYANEQLITVIDIPYEIVNKSIIFTKIRSNIEVKQRGLLSRLGTYDFVVLMEDNTPSLDKGIPLRDTNANYMYRALTDYVGADIRLKRRPMFMKGGFFMWKSQYPTYTKLEGKENFPQKNRDELDSFVQKYKMISSVNFPNITAHEPSSKNGKEIQPKQQEPVRRQTLLNDPGIPKPTFPPTKYSPTVFPVSIPPTLPDVKPNGAPLPRYDSIPPSPLQDANFAQPPVPSLPLHPATENQMSHISTNRPRIPPTPDRGTKPSLMTAEQENDLFSIYDQLMTAAERSGTKRHGAVPGITGLYNMGNTCFMSATLQCLFQTPHLSSIFTRKVFTSKVNLHNKMGTRGIISAAFSTLIDIVWSGQYQAIKPNRFLHLFADEVNSSLADGQQHDASEFQLFLLDALHEDTNEVITRISFEQNYKGGEHIVQDAADYAKKNQRFSYSPITRIFSVLTVSELRCCACSESSATFEENSLISAELATGHNGQFVLEDCLRSHFSQTKLDGGSRWNCPRCKSLQPAVRITKLWSLPPVLVIHLKRFSLVNGEYVKNSAPVVFEKTRFDPSSCLHPAASREQKTVYRLYAVTNHSGRLNSGHYTSIVSHLQRNEWLRFDDESVTSTDSSSIDIVMEGVRLNLIFLVLSSFATVVIAQTSRSQQAVIADLGKLIVDNCPPMLCTGLDCAVVTERNGCQLCACPIGSPSRGCDPMPFILWHDLIVNGCPNVTLNSRDPAQKVHRWFRRVNRFTNTDQCEPYIFPYCPELDFNLWRSPRTKQECELYCYSIDEQRKRGII